MQTRNEYISGREIYAVRCESAGEYTLPDYNGDVKRILMIKCTAYPSGRYANEDALEFSGAVGYEIVYLDEENNVTHAEFSTDYDAAVRISNENYVDSDVKSAVHSYNVRLVGPRKIYAKCTVESEVYLSEGKTYEIEGDAFDSYEPETLCKRASVKRLDFISGDERELSGEIGRIDGGIIDEVELLLSSAAPQLDKVDLNGGEAVLKGRIKLEALVRGADGSPYLIEGEIPYNECLKCERTDVIDESSARIEILSEKCSLIPSEDGVSICATLNVLPKIVLRSNTHIELISDAYLKERESENEYGDFSYNEHIASYRAEEYFNGEISLSDINTEPFDKVLYSNCAARVDTCEFDGNSVEIIGELRFSGIACQVSDEGESVYIPLKFSMPFKQNVNIDCQNRDNIRVNCSVYASESEIECDVNSLRASANLVILVNVSSEEKIRCLRSSYLSEGEFCREDSTVIAYYPDSTESLFDIAKKFHTSAVKIASDNRLLQSAFSSPSSPVGESGIDRLIIR